MEGWEDKEVKQMGLTVCVCMWIRCQEGQVWAGRAGRGDAVSYMLRNELAQKGWK